MSYVVYSYRAVPSEAAILRKKYFPYIKMNKKVVNEMNRNEQEFLVQKIRTQYTEKEYSALDELRSLDKKVKKPANVFAYIFGCIAAIIMGAGMSLVMTDLGTMLGLGDMMVPGIAVGVIGLAMALLTYPIYKKVLSARRKKYAGEIIRLSDSIMEK